MTFECMKKYDILHNLKSNFVEKIKKINVYGSHGNQVLITTKDDLVYAFGDNENGCLGLSTDCVLYEEPVIVEELCRKSIYDLSFGDNHVIALTTFGHLYSWGLNSFGQLGNGYQIDCFKPKLINDLIGEIVTDISCGSDHSLVLTETGNVFAFGYNEFGQIGNNCTENVLKPIKVNGFDGEKVIAISCGVYHSLALTQSGRVFSWGNNFYRQLGIRSSSDQMKPIHVNINRTPIHKIICGSYHNLLLTINGDIYAFGYNNCGQSGTSSKSDQIFPARIESQHKFVEICASSHHFMSCALTQFNKGFVWGKYGLSTTCSPKLTYPSIDHIFANYSDPKITYKSLSFQEIKKFSLNGSQISSFNQKIESDLKIKINDQYIYVHKSILMSRCDFFRSYFSNNWSQNQTNQIEISDYSFPVYHSFLKYLYTNCVEVSESEQIIELLDLADFYCEQELKLMCEKLMENLISKENVCAFYFAAINHNFRKLKQFCFLFALNNFKYVRETNHFKQMDSKVQQNFVESVQFL